MPIVAPRKLKVVAFVDSRESRDTDTDLAWKKNPPEEIPIKMEAI